MSGNTKKTEPYVLNDRVVIPDSIKKLSQEELENEIIRIKQSDIHKKTQNITM